MCVFAYFISIIILFITFKREAAKESYSKKLRKLLLLVILALSDPPDTFWRVQILLNNFCYEKTNLKLKGFTYNLTKESVPKPGETAHICFASARSGNIKCFCTLS